VASSRAPARPGNQRLSRPCAEQGGRAGARALARGGRLGEGVSGRRSRTPPCGRVAGHAVRARPAGPAPLHHATSMALRTLPSGRRRCMPNGWRSRIPWRAAA
jgi:hypothetical protein